MNGSVSPLSGALRWLGPPFALYTFYANYLSLHQRQEKGERAGALSPFRSERNGHRALRFGRCGELPPVPRAHGAAPLQEPAAQATVVLVVVALQVAGHPLRHDVGRSGLVKAQHPPGAVGAEVSVGRVEADVVGLDRAGRRPLLSRLVGEQDDHGLGHGVRVAGEKGGNLLLVHLITSE